MTSTPPALYVPMRRSDMAIHYNKGFSLVELSIVLVILGLLTGGILTGQNLIRAAELRSVTTEFQTYQTAVNIFKDQYFELPGDMTDATDLWGAAHATPATCLTTVGTGTQTCDGDGDGSIENAAAVSQYGELFTFWQHLANAGLIEGSYTGMTSAIRVDGSMLGSNVPTSKLGASNVWMAGTNLAGWTSATFNSNIGNTLALGSAVASGTSNGDGPVLTPKEAWNVDTKMDDGKPAYGKVQTYDFSTRPNCSTSDTAPVSVYAITDSTVGCILIFPDAF